MMRAFFLLAALSALASAQESRPLPSTHEKFPLRILYAGRADDPEHTKVWVDFLAQWFEKVGTTSYSDFQPKEADAYDVVVFEAKNRPAEYSIGIPKRPTLPQDYDRASVLVSGAGVLIGETLHSNLDWL